jgi:BlaI family penicillinase repressor
MAKKSLPQPTERELAILRILWDNGPGTVQQVNAEMNRERPTGYTTTLKLMQLMVEKGLLLRDEAKYKHIYSPAMSEERTLNQVVANLLDRAFAGSAEKLVMRALSAKKVSHEELARIRALLEKMEEK